MIRFASTRATHWLDVSRQLNFYALPADIDELEHRIGEVEPMVVLHHRSPSATPRALPTLRFTEDEQPLMFYYVVRKDDLPGVLTEQVPAQGYWTVDVLRSPVVEFNSCYFDGTILRRGRIYYVDGYYGSSDQWIEKPREFRRWAAMVRKAMRKR